MLPANLLASTALFDTMDADDIGELSKKLIERTLEPGELLFSKGDEGRSLCIIRSGAVQIFLPPENDRPRVVLKDLRTGDYFGELALLDDKPRSASVEATVQTEILELTRVDFTEHLGHSKSATLAILSELAERLRETNAMLSQRTAKDVVKEIEKNLTWSQRLADKVAELNGSWAFIILLLATTAAWLLANSWMAKPFDQYPYPFFNFTLAVVVSLQGALIVMSRNRQAAEDRAQSENDFQVNLKNEVGIETLLNVIDVFRSETKKRLEVLEQLAQTEIRTIDEETGRIQPDETNEARRGQIGPFASVRDHRENSRVLS